MEWILIVVLTFGTNAYRGGGSVEMQEFNSEAACKAALTIFTNHEMDGKRRGSWAGSTPYNWADCVPKGEKE